jgi:hypothetical protein
MQKSLPAQPARGALTRLIDAYNPGVTMLVSVWAAAFSARRYMMMRDALSQTGWEALTSLIYVVPIMLVGWAVLSIVERVLFNRDA